MAGISLAIHGGAGTLLRSVIRPEQEAAYRQSLQAALDTGYKVLEQGGTALEAVKRTVMVLEDDPLFNAGRGSVFTNKGDHEMDASIMDGATLGAGAVGGLKKVKNPILLAEQVMLHSGHVLLGGEGALEFARRQGLAEEPEEYFFTEFRHAQWEQVKEQEGTILDHTVFPGEEKKFGTVGAVALDQYGNLAAATSTGGMTNKRYGRMGDTPLIGCGTYANNHTCAISCTGHGELFIRAIAAYDVSALMEYKGLSLADAMKEVVHHKLVRMGGEGGMIGIDAEGNISMQFNSEGMYRASRRSGEAALIAIYGDE